MLGVNGIVVQQVLEQLALLSIDMSRYKPHQAHTESLAGGSHDAIGDPLSHQSWIATAWECNAEAEGGRRR